MPSDSSPGLGALDAGRRHIFVQPTLKHAPSECQLAVRGSIVEGRLDDEPRSRCMCFGGLRDTDVSLCDVGRPCLTRDRRDGRCLQKIPRLRNSEPDFGEERAMTLLLSLLIGAHLALDRFRIHVGAALEPDLRPDALLVAAASADNERGGFHSAARRSTAAARRVGRANLIPRHRSARRTTLPCIENRPAPGPVKRSRNWRARVIPAADRTKARRTRRASSARPFAHVATVEP